MRKPRQQTHDTKQQLKTVTLKQLERVNGGNGNVSYTDDGTTFMRSMHDMSM